LVLSVHNPQLLVELILGIVFEHFTPTSLSISVTYFVFFVVAVRVGPSERSHTDWRDCRHGGMAFVLTLSEWSGGWDLVLPQLNVSVRPVPGNVTCEYVACLLHKILLLIRESVLL
jgi:hypothetical protein